MRKLVAYYNPKRKDDLWWLNFYRIHYHNFNARVEEVYRSGDYAAWRALLPRLNFLVRRLNGLCAMHDYQLHRGGIVPRPRGWGQRKRLFIEGVLGR